MIRFAADVQLGETNPQRGNISSGCCVEIAYRQLERLIGRLASNVTNGHAPTICAKLYTSEMLHTMSDDEE